MGSSMAPRLLFLVFYTSHVASFGLHPSSIVDVRTGLVSPSYDPRHSIPSSVSLTAIRLSRRNPKSIIIDDGGTDSNTSKISRRQILASMFTVATTAAMLPVSSSLATNMTPSTAPALSTSATKSNFNYELGNSDCQTSCVRKCESSFPDRLPKKNRYLRSNNSRYRSYDTNTGDQYNDCLDACVRSGDRYCHQMTSSKESPSFAEATKSRYVITTGEPEIISSKSIPGLAYNANRGGAWRDGVTTEAAAYPDTTEEAQIQSAKPIPGLQCNSNRGGSLRD